MGWADRQSRTRLRGTPAPRPAAPSSVRRGRAGAVYLLGRSPNGLDTGGCKTFRRIPRKITPFGKTSTIFQ